MSKKGTFAQVDSAYHLLVAIPIPETYIQPLVSTAVAIMRNLLLPAPGSKTISAACELGLPRNDAKLPFELLDFFRFHHFLPHSSSVTEI